MIQEVTGIGFFWPFGDGIGDVTPILIGSFAQNFNPISQGVGYGVEL